MLYPKSIAVAPWFRFKDNPAVLGYELINEPWTGDIYQVQTLGDLFSDVDKDPDPDPVGYGFIWVRGSGS